MKKCIGFGEFERKCVNPAGSSHSKLWCQRCDNLRMAHLDKQFARLADSIGAPHSPPFQPRPIPEEYADKRITVNE